MLLMILRQQTEKAIAVYPNSGEVWDGRAKRWLVSRRLTLRTCFSLPARDVR